MIAFTRLDGEWGPTSVHAWATIDVDTGELLAIKATWPSGPRAPWMRSSSWAGCSGPARISSYSSWREARGTRGPSGSSGWSTAAGRSGTGAVLRGSSAPWRSEPSAHAP